MFDTKKLFKAVSDLGGKVAKGAARYAPAAMSEDKRFSNAYAASLALLVCADLEVEADETIAALNFMQGDPSLRDRGLIVSALGFYGEFIDDLSGTFSNQPSYLLKKAQIIQEHIAVDLNPAYKRDLMTLCNALIGANANPLERIVYDEIMIALR